MSFKTRVTIIICLLWFASAPILAMPLLQKTSAELIYNLKFNNIFPEHNTHKLVSSSDADKAEAILSVQLIVLPQDELAYRDRYVPSDFYDLNNKGFDLLDNKNLGLLLLLDSLKNKSQVRNNFQWTLASITSVKALLTIISKVGYENRGQELLVNPVLFPKENNELIEEEIIIKTNDNVIEDQNIKDYSLHLLLKIIANIKSYFSFYIMALVILITLYFLVFDYKKNKSKRRKRRKKNHDIVELKPVKRRRKRRRRRNVVNVTAGNKYKANELKISRQRQSKNADKQKEFYEDGLQSDKSQKDEDLKNKLIFSVNI